MSEKHLDGKSYVRICTTLLLIAAIYVGPYFYLRATRQIMHYVSWSGADAIHRVNVRDYYGAPPFKYFPFQSVGYYAYWPLMQLERSYWQLVQPKWYDR